MKKIDLVENNKSNKANLEMYKNQIPIDNKYDQRSKLKAKSFCEKEKVIVNVQINKYLKNKDKISPNLNPNRLANSKTNMEKKVFNAIEKNSKKTNDLNTEIIANVPIKIFKPNRKKLIDLKKTYLYDENNCNEKNENHLDPQTDNRNININENILKLISKIDPPQNVDQSNPNLFIGNRKKCI